MTLAPGQWPVFNRRKGNPSVSLAVVLRPRGDDWLKDELMRMKRDGVETVVSLLEPTEAAALGLRDEGSLAEEIGMRFLSFPVPDVHVPADVSAFRRYVDNLGLGSTEAATLIAHDELCLRWLERRVRGSLRSS